MSQDKELEATSGKWKELEKKSPSQLPSKLFIAERNSKGPCGTSCLFRFLTGR
jgi:hypothetical protein